MAKYTINDVAHIIPVEQTKKVREAIELYLNEGVIPEADPCISCEPNHIRKLISLIQIAERNGLFPPKRVVNEPDTPDESWSEETLEEAEDQDE